MRVHRFGVGVWHDQRGGLGARGADSAKDAGGQVAGVAWGPWPGPAFGPDAGERALLAHPGVHRENGPPDRFLTRLTPDTKPPAACRGHDPAALLPPLRRSLFKCLLRVRVGFRVLRTHRKTAKPQSSQLPAGRAFMHDHAKFRFDLVLQIDPSPPYNAVFGKIRTRTHPVGQGGFLLRRQPGRPAA